MYSCLIKILKVILCIGDLKRIMKTTFDELGIRLYTALYFSLSETFSKVKYFSQYFECAILKVLNL